MTYTECDSMAPLTASSWMQQVMEKMIEQSSCKVWWYDLEMSSLS